MPGNVLHQPLIYPVVQQNRNISLFLPRSRGTHYPPVTNVLALFLELSKYKKSCTGILPFSLYRNLIQKFQSLPLLVFMLSYTITKNLKQKGLKLINPFILPILLVTTIQHLSRQNQFQNLHRFQFLPCLKMC